MIISAIPDKSYQMTHLLYHDGYLEKSSNEMADYIRDHFNSKAIIGCWRIKTLKL